MKHKQIRNRHWLVDIGFSFAGSMLAAAIASKSWLLGSAAIVIGGLSKYLDSRNIEDEEREMNDTRG